ncbi:MAG: hypothetical protein LBF78_12715 [Treponema sp.]|jgi:hypothetical protein|nr:hypothetical protein [Treponema sp.]
MDNLLTEYQISKIFNITSITLKKLLYEKKIPYVREGGKPLFRMDVISNWVINNPLVKDDEEVRLRKLQAEWQRKSPEVLPFSSPWIVKLSLIPTRRRTRSDITL